MRKKVVIILFLLVSAFVYSQGRIFQFTDLGIDYRIMELDFLARKNLSASDVSDFAYELIEGSPYRWRLEAASSMKTVVSIISSRLKTEGMVYFVTVVFPHLHQLYLGIIFYPRNQNPIYTFYSRPM